MCAEWWEDVLRDRYDRGDTPWDLGRPDNNLIANVREVPVPPCAALDIGCGTGSDSVWMAEQGFAVTGIDISRTAVRMAEERAREHGVDAVFAVADALDPATPPGAPYSFAYDRGCLHSYDFPEDRTRLAENLARWLEPGAPWLSLSGSRDEKGEGPGPPRLSASEITEAVESFFEIRWIRAGHFDTNRNRPRRAWICLFERRAAVLA
ncbi:MAG: class I SAM-dependent methyltransferase [Desulfatibacillaceae bacterium]